MRAITLALILSSLRAAAQAYNAGDDYIDSILPFKGATWANSGDQLRDLEYQVRFALQTDKQLKELTATNQRTRDAAVAKASAAREAGRADAGAEQEALILTTQLVHLTHITDDLDRILVSACKEARRVLTTTSNPSLIKMMLSHYFLFVRGQSQNANWPTLITDLSTLEPAIAREAEEAAKKLR